MMTLSNIKKTDEWIEANLYNHDSKKSGYLKLSLNDFEDIEYKKVTGYGPARQAMIGLSKLDTLPETYTFCWY
ncbi:MAG: hypothetical protein M0Q90_16335 [Bacteroidales bacterium]|jgi:hypothetical protein|nr:hypothetical protein [Bacteroidales bacterium]